MFACSIAVPCLHVARRGIVSRPQAPPCSEPTWSLCLLCSSPPAAALRCACCMQEVSVADVEQLMQDTAEAKAYEDHIRQLLGGQGCYRQHCHRQG